MEWARFLAISLGVLIQIAASVALIRRALRSRERRALVRVSSNPLLGHTSVRQANTVLWGHGALIVLWIGVAGWKVPSVAPLPRVPITPPRGWDAISAFSAEERRSLASLESECATLAFQRFEAGLRIFCGYVDPNSFALTAAEVEAFARRRFDDVRSRMPSAILNRIDSRIVAIGETDTGRALITAELDGQTFETEFNVLPLGRALVVVQVLSPDGAVADMREVIDDALSDTLQRSAER